MPGVPVTIPSVGESITEGILSRWLKSDGSPVQAGEPLFELETDKASSDVPAAASGVLHIRVAEGETVAIGATVATIDPADSSAPAAQSGTPKGRDGPTQKPAAKSAEQPAGQRPEKPRMPPQKSEAAEAKPKGPAASTAGPAARRVAAENAVDMARVAPTGPGGRVTKGDVLEFLETAPKEQGSQQPATGSRATTTDEERRGEPAAPEGALIEQQSPAIENQAPALPREKRQRMSGLRQRIAERLVEIQQTAAILTTFNEADCGRILELRAAYKESFQKKHGVGLGFMSFFVKAVVEALKTYPVVNARIDESEIVFQNFYDIGVAVSTDRGLVVPIVRDADRLSFAEIEQAIADAAAKARSRTLKVSDLQGGTFTISNGGTFGSLLSTPILNPPQSAILGMHAIKKRPVVVNDQIVVRPMMYLALSYDHRLIDGRDAVSFLVHVKDCVESPERMLLGL
jgi:2-oxoglutarate dehydrogenase E2 component (dihydrolipoamide succinyltransferase)